MKVNIEKQEKNVVQLDIEIEAEVVAQEYSKTCRKFNNRVTIPGFRKGKAPRNILESHVGSQKLQRETLESLLPNVFADTISEHQFDLATEPFIEKYEFASGQPLKVLAKLELKPDVVLNNYKGNVVEVLEFKSSEDAVKKELDMLAQRLATLSTVVDRPAALTDIVVIDFLGMVDGEPIKGGSAKNQHLDLANNNFIKGFSDQIIGKSVGEEFDINVTFPQNYIEASLSGKDAVFQIKINEIKQKNIPEINDELAKKVAKIETLDELKADIRNYLEKSVQAENKSRSEKEILNKVLDQAQVEVSDTMTNREARILLEEVQANLKNQGVSWEQVLDAQGHENIWNNLREEASKRVKTNLVLGAIAKTENIQVSDEEMIEKVKELANLYATDEKTVLNRISESPALANSISHQIMTQKVISFLLSNNEIKYIEDNTQDQDSEESK